VQILADPFNRFGHEGVREVKIAAAVIGKELEPDVLFVKCSGLVQVAAARSTALFESGAISHQMSRTSEPTGWPETLSVTLGGLHDIFSSF
jgi:hypothetical protein